MSALDRLLPYVVSLVLLGLLAFVFVMLPTANTLKCVVMLVPFVLVAFGWLLLADTRKLKKKIKLDETRLDKREDRGITS